MNESRDFGFAFKANAPYGVRFLTRKYEMEGLKSSGKHISLRFHKQNGVNCSFRVYMNCCII